METNGLLIKRGRIFDPDLGIDREGSVLIRDNTIAGIGSENDFNTSELTSQGVTAVDAAGLLVTPGLIDIHVHLREPGQEWKETIQTGSAAAVAGGFTGVCCMPNTQPVNDSAQVTEFILEQAEKASLCRVHPIGAVSKGLEGKELSPLRELADAGCVAFSDDGRPVWDPAVMRAALEYGKSFDAVFTCHEEELALSNGFSMNESALSLEMGLRGMPEAAENVMIARDIELARLCDARLHFCHVSTARGVKLIQRAKEDGIPVTAEVAPHHLVLTEEAVRDYNTAAKVSMPLRKEVDIVALQEGLASGVIDCIASDHAPHEADSKAVEFDKASFGLIGLQTTLPLTLGLVRERKISLEKAISALTSAAAKCLNLPKPKLAVGAQADLTLIDLDAECDFTAQVNRSKSFNSPFANTMLKGLAAYTITNGNIVFELERNES